MSDPQPRLRAAVASDIARLEELIAASVRGLQVGDYTSGQIEGALRAVFGVDHQLIADATYFALETAAAELVACGGWSFRRTLFGAHGTSERDATPLRPGQDAARIRAFFVRPAWARRGLAGRLLQHCEAQARAQGFTATELGATLTGVPFYARHGYREVERLREPLADGDSLAIVRMARALGPSAA